MEESTVSQMKMLLTAACVFMVLFPARSEAVDWANVPTKKIMLFYPAQASWDRLMTPGRHSGRSKYIVGKNCVSCHGDIDEHPLGEELVHAEKDIEPTPIPGKPGFVDTQVSMAHDADTLYVRIQFNPGEQPDAGMDKDFETKVTMMLDDGSVPEMTRAGCWATCHDGLARMPNGTDDATKYIFESRKIGPNSVAIFKDADELAEMRRQGQYLEYWQARLNPGRKPIAVDGIVLDRRAENPKPEVAVLANSDKGGWTVTFARKLAGSDNHKAIMAGKVYTIGFAIHAGHTFKRFHYVSFARTFVLDEGTADFVVPALQHSR